MQSMPAAPGHHKSSSSQMVRCLPVPDVWSSCLWPGQGARDSEDGCVSCVGAARPCLVVEGGKRAPPAVHACCRGVTARGCCVRGAGVQEGRRGGRQHPGAELGRQARRQEGARARRRAQGRKAGALIRSHGKIAFVCLGSWVSTEMSSVAMTRQCRRAASHALSERRTCTRGERVRCIACNTAETYEVF